MIHGHLSRTNTWVSYDEKLLGGEGGNLIAGDFRVDIMVCLSWFNDYLMGFNVFFWMIKWFNVMPRRYKGDIMGYINKVGGWYGALWGVADFNFNILTSRDTNLLLAIFSQRTSQVHDIFSMAGTWLKSGNWHFASTKYQFLSSGCKKQKTFDFWCFDSLWFEIVFFASTKRLFLAIRMSKKCLKNNLLFL